MLYNLQIKQIICFAGELSTFGPWLAVSLGQRYISRIRPDLLLNFCVWYLVWSKTLLAPPQQTVITQPKTLPDSPSYDSSYLIPRLYSQISFISLSWPDRLVIVSVLILNRHCQYLTDLSPLWRSNIKHKAGRNKNLIRSEPSIMSAQEQWALIAQHLQIW